MFDYRGGVVGAVAPRAVPTTGQLYEERYAGVANQYAVTEIFAFLASLPVMFAVEGKQVWTG